MRLLPELLGLLNKKTDNSHELALMDKQIELQKQKGADDRLTAEAQGAQDRATMGVRATSEETLKLLDLHAEAIKSQMQVTGNKWVDALNFLVRPLTTYYFLGCYGIVKTAMIIIAVQHGDAWNAIVDCWNEQDAMMLWGILNFWFVGRCFDKKK